MARYDPTVMAWARVQEAGHVITKAVLLVLASHADRSGYASPSQRSLAKEAEVSQATASRHLKVLLERNLVRPVRAGAGRQTAGYQLVIPGPGSDSRSASQADPVVMRSGESQDAGSDAPEGITTDDRSDSHDDRSDSQRSSDQPISGLEEVPTEPTEEEAAARLSRVDAHAGATPARGRRGERVSPGELDRTAHSGSAYVLVAAWADRNPGVANGHRRELGRAVDELLRSRADPALIPAALDEAHDPRFRNPVKALPLAYEDVRRRSAARPGQVAMNPNDARALAFMQGTSGTAPIPPALGGPKC